jgi:5-methylcytosine-specific restriction endonuclease McrA
MSEYPNNWKELTYQLKEKNNWKCSKCGRQCIKPGEKVNEQLTRSERAKLTLQAHHSDYDVSNNCPENLRILCSACHLSYHCQRRSNLHPNQLRLNLNL